MSRASSSSPDRPLHDCLRCGEPTDLKDLCESCIEAEWGPGRRQAINTALVERRLARQAEARSYLAEVAVAAAANDFDAANGHLVKGETLDYFEWLLRARMEKAA